MGLLDILTRADEQDDEPTSEDLLVGNVTRIPDIGKREAMAIPAFAACVEVIAGTVATLPVRLYEKSGHRISEVTDDRRTAMLNGDSGDTLTGPEIKRAVVEDYLCSDNGGYIYVNKVKGSNDVESIHYVNCYEVAALEDSLYDPIFKSVAYLVGGRRYHDFDFVRLVRSTRNGRTGRSVITANREALAVAYSTMLFEQSLVGRGGSKRGFLQSSRRLGKNALTALKTAWRRFYGSTDESVVIMNDGITFQEASATSTEMQLNENKQTNSADIYSMFRTPPEIIRSGGTDNASKNARDNFVRFCIMQIITEFAAALNRSLLLEGEKGSRFFEFDLSELTKADMKERWEAWEIAKRSGFVMTDEVRTRENLEPLGLDYINLGLNDVLLDTAKNQIIIPNMGRAVSLDNMSDVGMSEEPGGSKGGEKDEGELEG